MKKLNKKSPHSRPKQDKDLKNNFCLIIAWKINVSNADEEK